MESLRIRPRRDVEPVLRKDRTGQPAGGDTRRQVTYQRLFDKACNNAARRHGFCWNGDKLVYSGHKS